MTKILKSKKITNQLRWSLRQKAVDLKFKKEKKKLSIITNSLAEDIYQQVYKEWLPIMKQLPDNAFYKQNNFYVRWYKGDSRCSYFLRSTKEHLMFYQNDIHLTTNTPEEILLIARIEELRDMQEAHNTKVKAYERKVLALLNQVTTTGKLIELMPEAQNWMIENSCSDIPVANAVAELRKL